MSTIVNTLSIWSTKKVLNCVSAPKWQKWSVRWSVLTTIFTTSGLISTRNVREWNMKIWVDLLPKSKENSSSGVTSFALSKVVLIRDKKSHLIRSKSNVNRKVWWELIAWIVLIAQMSSSQLFLETFCTSNCLRWNRVQRPRELLLKNLMKLLNKLSVTFGLTMLILFRFCILEPQR